MRFVIQRVARASVISDGRPTVSIDRGLLLFVAIHRSDSRESAGPWVERILRLRIFADEKKPINRSIQEMGGEILVVSQFTLYGDCRGQNRPSFTEAARPDDARPIYDHFVSLLKSWWPKTETGEFGADMEVNLVNEGPVTIILE